MTRFPTALVLLLPLGLATPAAAQRETETIDRTLTLSPGGTLRLKTFSGRVRIGGGPGDQVVIHAVRRAERDRLRDISLDITQRGTAIEVDANHRVGAWRRNNTVVETDFDIRVPSRTDLDIRTFSAPVTVSGVTGRHRVDGFSADVAMDWTEWADASDLDVSTFSGSVRLRLPDQARGRLVFNSFSGRFESDLAVAMTSGNRRRNIRGSLNGGGASEFRFRSFSGDVTIRR